MADTDDATSPPSSQRESARKGEDWSGKLSAVPPGMVSRLGPYTIIAPLGAGGMGEVYQAVDDRLGRTVAIKILRDRAAGAARQQRFEREARAASRLNHPHICALYDVGREHGLPYLVMEYADGETLARRLRRGPLPLEDVLQHAVAIAAALDHAHAARLVHRDLKPANVMLTRAGAKLLDFGLAQWRTDPAGDDPPRKDGSETLTEEGMIAGTLTYMSPEQLEGTDVDARSDIFSLGVLIYEMATGRNPFDGANRASVIANVLTRDPEPLWAAHPAATRDPRMRVLDQVVSRCLNKDRHERWQTARDLRQMLEWTADGRVADGPPASRGGPALGLTRLGYVLSAAAAALVTFLTMWPSQRVAQRDGPPSTVRASIVLPEGQRLTKRYDNDFPLALSPDGSRLAYVAAESAGEQLYVRNLGELAVRPVPGTRGARHPFFSPKGDWIAFFAGNALQKVRVAGGAPVRICAIPRRSAGGAWGTNDTIVFATEDGLFRVDANGGAPERLEGTEDGRWPDILPDGNGVLFGRNDGIYAASFDRTPPIPLARVAGRTSAVGNVPVLGEGAIAQVHLLPTGHIVYGQDPGSIRAVPFDLASLQVTGPPVPLVDDVFRVSSFNAVYFAVARSGVLVYAPENPYRSLAWVDRKGHATPLGSDRERFRVPRLSPDGRRITVAIDNDTRRADLWLYDARTAARTRLTNEKHNLAPVWTPDGTRVTHSAGWELVVQSADGSDAPRVLLPVRPPALQGRSMYSSSWSADGRRLLFWSSQPYTGQDLWEIGDGAARPLVTTAANEKFGAFSPDGRWVAYQSDESGRDEVYVMRYPDATGKVAASTAGGGYPVWGRDGRELFYRQGHAMVAVPVSMSHTFTAGVPRVLFDDPAYVGTSGDLRFDVSLDGRRFLTPVDDRAASSQQLVIVHNWSAEVQRLVPSGR